MEIEYEVETILKAKVFMRGKKMGWKFYVKWKGYDDSNNTWEPFKSFENSGEKTVEQFWERVDTKDRDINSVDGWTNGEEVFPTGPSRRKGRPISRKDEPTNVRSSSTDDRPFKSGTANGARVKRLLESPESRSSSKRKRASSSRRKSDTQRTRRSGHDSHSPVPDSQPEDDELLIDTLPKTADDDMHIDVDASELAEDVNLRNSVTSSVQGQFEKPEQRGRLPISSRVEDHVKSQPSTPTPVDEMSFSAPLSGSNPEVGPLQGLTAPQTRSAKNGKRGLKGRDASLLTFSKKKGALETLKRSRTVKDNEAVGDTEEVLELLESTAGLRAFDSGSSSVGVPLRDRDGTAIANTEGHSLPDHEEQNRPCPSSPSIELPDKMPTSISFPEPSSSGPSPWKRATIFGPLAIGAGFKTWASNLTSDVGESSIPRPFLLSLDNSISVPVALKDVSSAQSLHHIHLESIVSGASGPPGKLYTSHAATALLETLETGGSCARLVIGDTATIEQRRVFDAFCTKLGEGGLFVAMASSEVLACCSSTNEECTKKLALAATLRGLSETVVVSHVKVINYSAFADAAAQAESVRW